jgi:hypothetical protein
VYEAVWQFDEGESQGTMAYYLTFGWVRDLPEWSRPIVWGLAVALPVVLMLAWMLWPRS